jgi:hypothetical protein
MGKTTDWNELTKDCVASFNATWGRFLSGIQDGHEHPQDRRVMALQGAKEAHA